MNNSAAEACAREIVKYPASRKDYQAVVATIVANHFPQPSACTPEGLREAVRTAILGGTPESWATPFVSTLTDRILAAIGPFVGEARTGHEPHCDKLLAGKQNCNCGYDTTISGLSAQLATAQREKSELLAAEHALGAAYVRLRTLIPGAFDTPHAPTAEEMWAHVERCLQAALQANAEDKERETTLANNLFAVLMGANGLITMCREHFIERELKACDGNFLFAPECLTALRKIKEVSKEFDSARKEGK